MLFSWLMMVPTGMSGGNTAEYPLGDNRYRLCGMFHVEASLQTKCFIGAFPSTRRAEIFASFTIHLCPVFGFQSEITLAIGLLMLMILVKFSHSIPHSRGILLAVARRYRCGMEHQQVQVPYSIVHPDYRTLSMEILNGDL